MNTPTPFFRYLQQLISSNVFRYFPEHHIGKELKNLSRRNHSVDPTIDELDNLRMASSRCSGMRRQELMYLMELSSHQSMAEYSNTAILRQIADHEEQIRILRAKLK